jgi:23S rRNA pseudouridine1911/1915/1917 synthase
MESEEGMRLDRFLIGRFPHYSRSYFQSLIEQRLVLVNGELIKKGAKLVVDDEIEVEFAVTSQMTLVAEPIPLDIIYEDEHLLAINKPAGMVVHPAVGNWTGTFVHALLYHCEQLATHDTLRPGIVHRLDKETSGLLIAAKDEMTQRRLVEAFASRRIHKEYIAICLGNPGNRKIVGHIGRHPTHRKQMAVLIGKGKQAETVCQTLAHNAQISLVRLLPHTGRTHQLRVHMQSIGTPILGDKLYGSPAANKRYGVSRQLLHAKTLRFLHPMTQEEMVLEAPIPQDIGSLIEMIK